MGTNGQAMPRASSSAEEADEGGGASGGFPFVVLSGGEVAQGEPVNPAFAAYARRSVSPTRTAREALAFALAEAETAEAGAGGDAARVDEASYGVTRSPFAGTTVSAASSTPKVEAKTKTAPSAPAPAQEAAKKEGAARRRPALRASDVSAPPAPPAPAVPHVSAGPVTPAAFVPPPPSAEPFAPAVAPAGVASEAGAAPAPGAGKLKVTLRRDVPTGGAAPAMPPATPPPDAPFFFGPVMDGSRAPLVPLPVASGAPGGAFVPPAHVATRSPFPSAGAASAPLAGGAVQAGPVGKPAPALAGQRRSATRRAGDLGPERRRVAVVCVSLVVLGLVVYFGQKSPYWPIRIKQAAVVGDAKPAGVPEGSPAEVASEAISPRAASPARLSVQAVAHPTRPAPSAGFVGLLEGFRITGVLQGEPVRAIIDGRLVQAGDLVDVAREVRLVGLDVAGRQLIFEDRTTARASVRY